MRLYTATSRKKPSSLHHLEQYASPNIMFVTFGHGPGERANSGGRASPAAARARADTLIRPPNEPARPCSPAERTRGPAQTRTAAQVHKPEPPRRTGKRSPTPAAQPRTSHTFRPTVTKRARLACVYASRAPSAPSKDGTHPTPRLYLRRGDKLPADVRICGDRRQPAQSAHRQG